MKKLTPLVLGLFILCALTSCELLLEDLPSDSDPEVTMPETDRDTYALLETDTVPVPEESTEKSPDTTAESATEPVTEGDTKIIPNETLEPVVFEDESLNQVVDGLRAEGYDMEQLTFYDIKPNATSSCTVFLNHRYFTHGDMLRFTVDDLITDGKPVSMRQEFPYQANCRLVKGDVEVNLWKDMATENRCSYALLIHDGIEPGVYDLQVKLNSEIVSVCPVIVYADPTPLPTAPTVYEDDALNGVMNGLREEGHDMEKLVWREMYYGEGVNFYHAVLNGRAFRPGDTVELYMPVLMSAGRSYYDSYPEGFLPLIFLFQSVDVAQFVRQDVDHFTYTIPEDFAPGVYRIHVQLDGEDIICICHVVVY